ATACARMKSARGCARSCPRRTRSASPRTSSTTTATWSQPRRRSIKSSPSCAHELRQRRHRHPRRAGHTGRLLPGEETAGDHPRAPGGGRARSLREGPGPPRSRDDRAARRPRRGCGRRPGGLQARDAPMILALFSVLVIVAVGGRASDGLRLSQAESILARLSDADARAYYDVLRRRVRRTIVMRGLSLIALLCIFWVLRHRLMQG